MNKLKQIYGFLKPIIGALINIVALVTLCFMMLKDVITNKDIITTIYCSLILVWWSIDIAVENINEKIEHLFEEEEIEEEITK